MLRFTPGVLAVSLTCACASAPPRVSPTPARAPAVAVSQTELDQALRKRGYRPATYRGERVYCRNEPLTGSNLETKVCRTAQQIDDQERSGKDMFWNGNHPAGCAPTKEGCD